MNQRDVQWIAGIWIVLILAATVGAFFGDADSVAYFVLAAVFGALATGLYVFVRRWTRDRNSRDIRWIGGIWVLMAGVAIALALVTGQPSWSGFAATAVGFALTATYRWHRWRRRPCPDCGARMPSDADTCPRCGSISRPWIRHEDVWWVRGPDGTGQWLDERTGTFRLHTDGPPSTSPFSSDRSA